MWCMTSHSFPFIQTPLWCMTWRPGCNRTALVLTRKCTHLCSALLHLIFLHTSIFHCLPLQSVCPAWSFWQPFIIGQLSPSRANAPRALVFLLVVKHHCAFFLLFLLSFYILLHLLLPVCWLRPAGPAVPTLMSSPHSGSMWSLLHRIWSYP